MKAGHRLDVWLGAMTRVIISSSLNKSKLLIHIFVKGKSLIFFFFLNEVTEVREIPLNWYIWTFKRNLIRI